MAGEAFCGKAEHIHSEECPLQTLICGHEESDAHMHDESCILRELVCETEETKAHVHSQDCLSRITVCTLEETEGHNHTSDCTRQELICKEEERPPHTHDASCNGNVLTCTLAEIPAHRHDPSCYTMEVICQQEESEDHAHTESCMSNKLTCTQEETEGHSHAESCYEEKLCCALEETPGHSHTGECYRDLPGYFCEKEESPSHFHEESCYTFVENEYVCGLEETEGHTHSDACYQWGIGFGCGLTEAGGHVHYESCITAQTRFGCEKEITQGHTHCDTCYDILDVCPLEEHIHDESCYSDITADVETSDDWEMTFADLTRSISTAKNVLSVAQSQLGYQESTRNFVVDETGLRRGITRYGQWYGNPYGDWSAMFVSFCLEYSGVDAPYNGGPEAMRLEWEKENLYKPVLEYAPLVGHLIFLDRSQDGKADSVAIIERYDETHIHVIEGNVTLETDGICLDTVAQISIPLDDPSILGYGLIQDETAMMVLPSGQRETIAATTAYNANMFTQDAAFVLYTTSGANTYAFDGSGNAVPVYIDESGNITADVENPETLLWNFTSSGSRNSYYIQNLSTGRYMHAHSSGVTSTGTYASTLVTSGSGVKVRSNTEYARLDPGAGVFVMTQNQSLAATYQFGIREVCTVWLDGTNGGIMSLGGSPDEAHRVSLGDTIQLPTQWQSPEKYSYKLRGWYDIINHKYYAPGAEVTVTGDTVFYADWAASSYNIGQYNSAVADTVSTNEFITTRMFDYGVLFNLLSENVDVTFSASGHSEVWKLITSGKNSFDGNETLNFIMRDWDRGNEDISYPSGHNDINNPTNGGVYTGLYSEQLRYLLFDTGNAMNPETGEGVPGKQYLGTADHLFQYADDPSDPYYGYYYYDSERNAASYNQSAGRFYVYNYLECTRTSSGSSDEGKLSDFLPLNSPYVNTNGKNVSTYTYAGVDGEYNGTVHYMYDDRYNDSNNTVNNVGTNFWFGMSIDINFYLPNVPGSRVEDGGYGNQDIFGQDMHFRFSGDDDVWVLVDGRLVLDLGGIHGIESGDINFSTGAVTVNGASAGNIRNLAAGDHTLTILYLERGSSMSNCALYFNLAPRFSFSIQKEDVLTRSVLNGAEFSVYTDKACTVPAELWVSKASHDRGDPAVNTFKVTDGVANMWGMGTGNTYYIKETKPPDNEDYTYARGIISVTFDKVGTATYHVEMMEETNTNGSTTNVSSGFTIHGIRIDEETQNAYIVATNAPSWVKETTAIRVRKEWKDNLNHSGDPVTVYLTYTDQTGMVHRIREVQLGTENNWTHIWDNMPKYFEDGVTKIPYSIEEGYCPGYFSKVETDVLTTSTGYSWQSVSGIEAGKAYILSTSQGCLTTYSQWDTRLTWTSLESAKNSNLAQWTAEWVEEYSCYKFVNGAGIVLTSHDTDRYFYGTTNNVANQCMNVQTAGSGIRIFAPTGSGNFYFEAMEPYNSGKAYATTVANNAMVFTPYVWKEQTQVVQSDNWLYKVVNTPLEEETSLKVTKTWDYGFIVPNGEHEQLQVVVKLLANGKDTGRTLTLSLRNGWTDTFRGLPYTDDKGNVIVYSIEEGWPSADWIPYYGEVTTHSGDPPTYSTSFTNVYRWGTGAQLPSTGSAARLMYILCGLSIMLTSLVYGIALRRKRERRQL